MNHAKQLVEIGLLGMSVDQPGFSACLLVVVVRNTPRYGEQVPVGAAHREESVVQRQL